VLEAADEQLYFAGADVGSREVQRPVIAQSRERPGEPLPGRVDIALEKLERLPEDPPEPHQTVGLTPVEAALRRPAMERPDRDVDHLRQLLRGEARVPLQSLECTVRQAALDFMYQPDWIGVYYPQEMEIGVRRLTPFADRALVLSRSELLPSSP
jgi:hypothetical protein